MKHKSEKIMQNAEITEKLKNVPLFGNTNEERLLSAVSSSKLLHYGKGDEIVFKKPALYVIMSGYVRVYRTEGSHTVLLNTIKEGGVFGAAQLFCEEAAFSSVKAACACTCLQMPKAAVCGLLQNDFAFTENYVTFLSDRIRFLNKKIASFTAGNGEQTLAGYLLSQPAEDGVVTLDKNMSALASSLNLSRPTLYRAFISLSEQGLIEKNGKEVRIISAKKLENI
jgi:CRP-like cAMP-binding protein